MEISGNIPSCSLASWEANEAEYKLYLGDLNNWTKIPSLNAVTVHSSLDQQLVRFTGMVQDMLNPELFLEQYEAKNTITQQSRIGSGKYRDVPTFKEDEVFVEDSSKNVNGERQSLYCISVPALNTWVRQLHSRVESKQVTCAPVQRDNKRPHSDTEPSCSEGPSNTTEPDSKRLCPTFQPPARDPRREIELSLPLPDSQAITCLVKVYDNNVQLALNDVIEVIGFLILNDPSGNDEEMEEDDDSHFHNRPNSQVPRLHAVIVRKLVHNNPLLNPALDGVDEIVELAGRVRQELQLVLSQVLLGDQLVAEYLICHLISSVYQRSDLLAFGQFSLNISRVPAVEGYSNKLYSLLELMLTKSHFLPLTLSNLNKSTFIPKKDYVKNRLVSGTLQLSANTCLVLDETCMEAGQLDTTGVRNVSALGTLIMQQKVDYNFEYYNLEFHTNIPVLVLSEGKSLLQCDVDIPLVIDDKCYQTRNEIFEAASHYLQEPLLERIRKYLTVMRVLEYSLPQELEQVIQDDFVRLRRENGSKTSATDLHRMLVLARLLSLSHGEKVLSRKSWELACNMEQQRKQRVLQQQRRS